MTHERKTGHEWRTTTLGDCVVVNDATYSTKEAWPFINYLDTGNITGNRISEIQHLIAEKDKIPSRARRKVQPGDIVYSTVRPNQRHFGLLKKLPKNFLASTGFAIIRGKDSLARTDFIHWFLAQDHIVEHLHTIAEQNVSAYPSIRPGDIAQLELRLPPLPEQRRIAHILGTLDDKIALNRQMNETLEEMARAPFKAWFVDFEPVRAKIEGRWRLGKSLPGMPAELYDLFPDRLVDSELGAVPGGWKIQALDEIANFRNGLALQKFRPPENEERLPVVKIAQLRTNKAKSGEWAKADITPECIIDDGDVIFSWSGSLWVTVWCGGKAALNQHLFKVTSGQYPKWFYRHFTEVHLPEFQRIAADKATTMGHIKRQHLSEAKCVAPDPALLSAVDETFSNLLSKQIWVNVESRTLAALRDTLLPKLISGELSGKGILAEG